MNYSDFLGSKSLVLPPSGINPEPVNPILYDFQRDITAWALRRGRAAIFADCGLGKTPMQLEWSKQISALGDVLILAPLAVAEQTVAEGQKFGEVVRYCRHGEDVQPGITITNYEMLDQFDCDRFTGIVLDESSILKHYDSKTRTKIIESFRRTPYRLACTATPAPNDYMELGNHAEFLGVMSRTEMLSMFFVHDGGETQQWRLKGHAQADFWKWVCSWAVMLRKPSDLGYDDGPFILPPISFEQVITSSEPLDGHLFAFEAQTLPERIAARRTSVNERVEACAQRINATDEQWIVWCNLNSESDSLETSIPGSFSVKGSDTREYKAAAAQWFCGKICDCKLAIVGRRDKLALWNNSPTNSSTTKRINRGDLGNQESIKSATDLNGESICADGLGETKIKYDCIEQPQQISEMPDGVSYTRETNGEGLMPELQPNNGSRRILKSDSGSVSAHSKSLQNNSGRFYQNKMEGVRSVGAKHLQITLQNQELAHEDCTSITAIKPALLEDCSAHPAISDSENLGTMRDYWNKRQCICGGIKQRRVLISKPSIFGFGLNFQHCHNEAFVGLSDSWEEYYQAMRRCWRFGQKQPVTVVIVTSESEGAVLANIQRKEADANKMAQEMINHMHELNEQGLRGSIRTQDEYKTDVATGNDWTLHLGDCVDVARTLPDESIDFSVFSPPFASLYTYSALERDMGNSKTLDEFKTHFRFLVKELFRLIKPGRNVSFHCMNLPTSKQNHGYIGIRDFRGDLIRMFQEEGFIYHSEVCIWKDPVTAMQRTKALGLLWKQLKKDSCMSRQGIPDYLVTMRKPGENPNPVDHTSDEFPVAQWQKWASPVWMDIDPSDTLQFRSAREHKDERHICPLQLEVIRRALILWSKPGDLVFSPFAGIGSEGWESIRNGRKFVGIELKPSYWRQAVANLKGVVVEKEDDLFTDGATQVDAVE